MGISFTPFVNGNARDGSAVNDSLENVRKWMNGQIGAGDITANTARKKNFLQPESYGFPNLKTLANSIDIFGDSASMDKGERAFFSYDIGGASYVACPELCRTIYVERESWVDVTARFYMWTPLATGGAASGVLGVTAFMMMYFNDTAIQHTRRRHAALEDGIAASNYNKKEYNLTHGQVLSAGYHDIWVGVFAVSHTTTTPKDPIDDAAVVTFGNAARRVDIEARTFKIEVNAFA
jgi:hypothetical protein